MAKKNEISSRNVYRNCMPVVLGKATTDYSDVIFECLEKSSIFNQNTLQTMEQCYLIKEN